MGDHPDLNAIVFFFVTPDLIRGPAFLLHHGQEAVSRVKPGMTE
jgi:hypothetical protein